MPFYREDQQKYSYSSKPKKNESCSRKETPATVSFHMALPLHTIKDQFPIFKNRPELVYLDSAATSHKPDSVILALNDFSEKENASVHRGLYDLSTDATRRFENVRKKVSDLLGVSNPSSIAFTKGTTESINLIAHGLIRKKLKLGDTIAVTAMEHHANFIPWQQLCHQRGALLNILPVTKNGELNLSGIDSMLGPRTRLLCLTHISNVLGTINPIEEIISIAHRKKIPVLIDAAQSTGHYPMMVDSWDADFVVFSAHKMFGPFGTGVLYAKQEFAPYIEPLNFGGGAIRNVTTEHTEFLDYPYKLEPGTPHVAGVIGLGAAIDFIQQLDLAETSLFTRNLTQKFKARLHELGGARILGQPSNFGSIVSFQMENIHPHDVASFLAQANIAVRAGHHCAQPLLESMGVPATVRVSFSIYNTEQDIDKTIDALAALKRFWSR